MIGTTDTPVSHGASKPLHCQGCALFHNPRTPPDGKPGARILIVGDYPATDTLRGSRPFQDRAGIIITTALRHIAGLYQKEPQGDLRIRQLQTHLTYAVQCASKDKPGKETATKCRHYLDELIASIRPRVVIALGADAMRSVIGSTRRRFEDMRGSFIEQALSQPKVHYTALITYSAKAILAQPGLYNELLRDLKKAFLLAEDNLCQDTHSEEYLRKEYVFPHTVDEVRKVCDDIINYSNPGEMPEKHMIAVDTETTSLEAHDPETKMIAVSFSWAPLKATSIILDHPKGWWSPEELEQVKFHVLRVLSCPKPKALHHEKFDRQIICHRYGWPLENVAWDTMGGEHLLEEDKQGSYKLKRMTRTYLPMYAGYEDKVTELREQSGGATRAEENKRFKKATERYHIDLQEYDIALEQYEKDRAEYEIALEKWVAKLQAEKTRAQEARKSGVATAEERKINKDVVGKKPRGPRRPNEPEAPQHLPPFDYAQIPLKDLELYAAVDADVTRQHVVRQFSRMDAEYRHDVKRRAEVPNAEPLSGSVLQLMRKHVLPTSKTFAAMEFTGFPVDLKYLEELDVELCKVMEKTEQELYRMAGRQFVIGNPQEVTRILFDAGFLDKDGQRTVIDIDPENSNIKRTPRGQIKADEKSLLYIANQYKYDFPRLVVRYRKAGKARSPFLTNVREHAVIDGRMHPSFHITGTATGRSSSSGENMQNFPKKLAGYIIKKIFVPVDGCVLVNVDAKGAEVRVFTAYSHDEELIRSVNDGFDTHSLFTAAIYPDKYTYEYVEEQREVADRLYKLKTELEKEGKTLSLADATALVTAEAVVKDRSNTKRSVFGTLYGAHAAKIAETAGIPLETAQEVIDGLFRRYPSIPNYIHATEREVDSFQGVYTYTGRKRRFPLAARSKSMRSRSYRQAVNFKIQATSSDIVLWTLNQLYPVLANDLHGYLHATVHDSIVFSVPPKYVSQLPDLMREYGTDKVAHEFPWLPVKFLWDVEVGLNYGETVNIKEYLKKGQPVDVTDDNEEIISDDEVFYELQDVAE